MSLAFLWSSLFTGDYFLLQRRNIEGKTSIFSKDKKINAYLFNVLLKHYLIGPPKNFLILQENVGLVDLLFTVD